jgi:hypothetical protein
MEWGSQKTKNKKQEPTQLAPAPSTESESSTIPRTLRIHIIIIHLLHQETNSALDGGS